MGTKTITIDLEAYERLKRARIRSRESFSQVIKRAHWRPPASTAAALLEAMAKAPEVPSEVLERLDEAQEQENTSVASRTSP